jgi:CHAD domain-containing protein
VLQLDRATANKLNRRLRRVTIRLGAVRELDVLHVLVDELHVARRARSGSIGRVGVAIAKDRDDARKRLRDQLPVDDLRRIVRKLEKLVSSLADEEERAPRRSAGGRSAWRWALEARVAKRAARLHAAVDAAGAVYLPERLHEVRIAVKKLRYAVELASDAVGVDRAADLRPLKRGQEILGRMRDLQRLIDRVREVQAALAPPNLAVWRDLDLLVASLDDECRRLHARYMGGRGAMLVLCERLGRARAGVRSRRAVAADPHATTRRAS